MNSGMKKCLKKIGRVLLILLTIVLVFNEWLFFEVVMYAHGDMLHEGLTYSQWYESSIDGFYFILLVFILHSELTMAVLLWQLGKNKWIKGKLEKLRKNPVKKKRERRWRKMPVPRMLVLCAVLVLMTGMVGYLYMQRNELLQSKIAAQEWPLAGRYREIGELRILLTLLVQGCAASVYLLIRRWKDEKRGGKRTAAPNQAKRPTDEKPSVPRWAQIAPRTYSYNRELRQMEIARGIKLIGSYAFKDCSSLKSVYFPRSVHTIDNSAFSGCTALERITLPKGLKMLGSGAFEGCRSLKEIDLGSTIEKIKYHTFRCCGALQAITLPESVKAIELGAFEDCEKLETIHMPSVNELGNAAFIGCRSLRRITLPTGMQKIGKKCFARCTALEEIEIPQNVTEIPADAFAGCENLRRIRLHPQIETISRYAFTGCNRLESIEGVDLARFSLAFEHTPAYLAQYPKRERKSSFPLELAGTHMGKTLRDRGYTLFEEDREYSISRPGEDGVVIVSSWSSDEGPDEDGFGREEFYDWWMLDEQLCQIPGIPMWHDYSHLDMRLSEERWLEQREKAADILSQREMD